jgi:hypothetical protein
LKLIFEVSDAPLPNRLSWATVSIFAGATIKTPIGDLTRFGENVHACTSSGGLFPSVSARATIITDDGSFASAARSQGCKFAFFPAGRCGCERARPWASFASAARSRCLLRFGQGRAIRLKTGCVRSKNRVSGIGCRIGSRNGPEAVFGAPSSGTLHTGLPRDGANCNIEATAAADSTSCKDHAVGTLAGLSGLRQK